jgi:hypothetical protein
MKFVFLVEGKTEQAGIKSFLKRWLDLNSLESVGISTVQIRNIDKLEKRARQDLEGPDAGVIIAVIGLLDIYEAKLPFPGKLKTTKERITWGIDFMQKKVGLEKFRMFFAVHEIEAWLLSQPELFPRQIQQHLRNKTSNHPEKVNLNEPPGKLLGYLYSRELNSKYKKVIDGKSLFSQLDPQIAYKKCPYLKEMLDEMLSLAKSALS